MSSTGRPADARGLAACRYRGSRTIASTWHASRSAMCADTSRHCATMSRTRTVRPSGSVRNSKRASTSRKRRRSASKRSSRKLSASSTSNSALSDGPPVKLLLEGLQVGDEIVEVLIGDDPAPVRHARDRRLADDAAGADHLLDLRVGVELLAEVLSGEWRNRLVLREGVGDPAEAARPVAVDAAVALVEGGPGNAGSLIAGHRDRRCVLHVRKPSLDVRD